MFGSTILDVAIGLIFIYLILSMICSTANELVASIAKSRSKMLARGITKLLQGMGPPAATAAAPTPGAAKPAPAAVTTAPAQPKMTAALYDHPLIKSLAREGCRPSYIPARNFALALIDILVPSDTTNNGTKFEDLRTTITALPASGGRRALLLLLDNAKGDLDAFRAEIERWFNDAMSRVSGWYKYQTQWKLFLLGLVTAILLNVDTFNVVNSLYRDGTLRATVTAAASQAVARPLVLPDSTMSVDSLGHDIVDLQQQLDELALPIGWPSDPTGALGTFQRVGLFFQNLAFSDVLKVILGWVLTGLAISLGAPFWFDLLNNVMNVRIAGKRPGEEEGSPGV